MSLPGGPIGNYLKKNLSQGEQYIDSATGVPGDHLIATDRRAIILKRGTLPGSVKAFSYPYTQITAVDIREAVTGSWIQIGTAATPIRKTNFLGRLNAENLVQYSWVTGTGIKRVAGIIQQRIGQPMNVAAPAASIPDQIAQLAHLRDTGAITEAEYQQKKQELLNRM